MHLSNKKKSIIGLCFVALIFVLLSIGARLMNEGFPPFTQVYLRTGGAFLLAWAFFYKSIHSSKLKKIAKKDWLLLGTMGCIGYGLAVVFVTMAALNTTLLNTAIIGSTTPFFALLILFVIFRKPPKLSALFFLIISFIGVYVISAKSFSFAFDGFGIGELYALFFAAGTAAFIVPRKFLSKQLTNKEITVIVTFFAFVSSFAGAICMGEKLDFAGFTNPIALLGLVMGIVFNIIATQLQNFSYEHINPVAGSQIVLLQNVFAPILGFIFYAEIILPIELFGAALILLGIIGYYKKAAN